MKRLVLLACAASLPLSAAAQEPRTSVMGVGELLVGQDLGMALGVLPRIAPLERDPEVTDRGGLHRVVAGDVQEVVYLGLELLPDAVRSEGFVTLLGGDRLVVRGPEPLHQAVEGMLGGLGRIVAHRTRLELAALRLSPGSLDGLGEAELPSDWSRLGDLDGVASVERFELDLRVGATGYVDAGSRREVVAGYEVELANGTAVHRPIVAALRHGTRIAARFVPLGGAGRLALIVDRAEPADGHAPLEVPVITAGGSEQGGGLVARSLTLGHELQPSLARGLALDLELEAGVPALAGWSWELDGQASEELLLVRARFEPLDAVELLPVGAGALVFVDREAFEGSYSYAQRRDRAYLQSGQPHDLEEGALELVVQRSEPYLGSELLPRLASSWRRIGNWWVAAAASAEQAGQAASQVRELLEPWGETHRLRAVAEAGEGFQAAVELPASTRGQAFGFVVSSTPRLLDFDVAAAPFALAGVPVVGDLEQGLAVGLVPRPGQDALAVGVRGEVQRAPGGLRAVDLPEWPGGRLQRADLISLRVDQIVDLADAPVSVARDSGARIIVERR